jgi:PAS domain S-box-containing protein
LFLQDGQSRVVDVNRRGCESLGYTREELIGMTPLDFDSVITSDGVEACLARLSAGETIVFDSRHRRKDGTEFPVEIRTSPLSIDGKLHSLALVCDITERKRAEEKLRESEERLELALAASRMGVWDWDIGTNAVFWSPECYDIYGNESFDGRAETFRHMMHPDDVAPLGMEVQRTLHEGTINAWEFRVIGADGQVRWIANCAVVRRDEWGKAVKLIGTARDVTEQKLAKDALVEAQQRLAIILKGADVGIWDWDLATNQIIFSDEWKGQLGYADDEISNHYEEWESRVHPDDLAPALERVKRAIEQCSTDYVSEFRMRHKDGSWCWILSLGSVIAGGDGRPARMLGVHIDITDRKRAEESLQASESRYRSFVDHATDALFLQDCTGRVVDVNQQACVSLGYERDELIGMMPAEFDPELTPGYMDSMLQRLETGETVAFDSRHQRRDGSTFPVEVRLRPFWIKDQRFHIGLVRDITERKRTEQALRDSETRLRTLLENLDNVAVQAYEPDGTITFWNRASELFYGYSAAEALGRDAVALLWANHAREPERRIMAEALRTGKRPGAEEVEVVRRDGTKITVFASCVVHPRAGRQPEFFCFDVDISDRKRAEEELALRQAELLHASRLSTVGQMVAEISHEVAQPLNAIGNFAAASDRILENNVDGQMNTLHEYVRAILDQNQRCITILDRLRDFSRRAPSAHANCHIGQLLHESVKLMSLELRRNNVVVQLQQADALPPVQGDRIQLQQVIVNLLTNARDALQDQDEDRRTISIRAFAEPEAVVFEVEDAGSGLSGDATIHLFDPFFTTKRHGMGIGLSICQSIVKNHGGRIDAFSNPHGGATFRVRLPLSRSKSHD